MFGSIGPNGAGKSTTIRFLATLLRATTGEGFVNGYSVTRDPIGVRKSVGYMPDNFGVYDGMKVWEFLDFFAVAYQIPRGRRKAVIGDVLELLDLTHKRDDFVNNPETGVSLLRSDPKVRDVHMNHRSCTLEMDGDESDVQRLLRQLVAADCGLISFAEKEPTLEDVFMMVTKGLVT